MNVHSKVLAVFAYRVGSNAGVAPSIRDTGGADLYNLPITESLEVRVPPQELVRRCPTPQGGRRGELKHPYSLETAEKMQHPERKSRPQTLKQAPFLPNWLQTALLSLVSPRLSVKPHYFMQFRTQL